MIHLLIGSTGAGKSTYAKKLAKQRDAQVFRIDEWMKILFFPDIQDEIVFDWAMERINRCEALIWKHATDLLDEKIEVILEISMTTREQRNKQIKRAQASSFPHQIHFLDVDRDIRLNRILNRNKEKGETYSFDVDEDMFNFVEDMYQRPDDKELEGAIIIKS